MRQSSMTSSPLPLTGDRKAGQERAPLTAWWFHSERRRMRRQSTSKFISAVLFSSAVGATLEVAPRVLAQYMQQRSPKLPSWKT
jgi:hypothetical protein